MITKNQPTASIYYSLGTLNRVSGGVLVVGVTHIQMALIGDVNRKTFVLVATFCYPGG